MEDKVERFFHSLRLRNISKIVFHYDSKLSCYILILFSVFMASMFFYASVVSKFMPDTGIEEIDFIKYDRHYCYLIPMLILPTYVFLYFNWLSIQIFENN